MDTTNGECWRELCGNVDSSWVSILQPLGFFRVLVSVLHGRPWVFFGPPVPLPAKNRTRSRGRGNFTATGAGPLRDPVFPRALRVTGFQAIAGIWI